VTSAVTGSGSVDERSTMERLATRIIKPLRNNFVERPWGGTRIREFKHLCPLPDQRIVGGAGLGEAFEIAAYDDDDEAGRFPSKIRLEDGSAQSLPRMLESYGDVLLGTRFVQKYGRCFPLLPKTLDIKELLSVQGHPSGNTEVYVIIDAEPGATIRVGFNRDVDAGELQPELIAGRRKQQTLLTLFAPDTNLASVQYAIGRWMSDKQTGVSDALARLEEAGCALSSVEQASRLLDELKKLYWYVLDMMNEIRVEPGQIIYNANPERILAGSGKPATAEVHALGNPEGREVVALEIRRPGPTFRAWDNVRFPLRDIDIIAALEVLNLRRTEPAEFIVDRKELSGRAGVSVSVDSDAFRLEHLAPTASLSVDVPAESTHCLHALGGSVRVLNGDEHEIGSLERGESAIVPAAAGAYTVYAESASAQLVKVSLPQ